MIEASKGSNVSTVATSVKMLSDLRPPILTDNLVKLQMAGARFPGFWSGEIIAPSGANKLMWQLVQRFSTNDQAAAWHRSDLRRQLIGELAAVENGAALQVFDELSQNSDADVATAIVTDLKPGKEEEFFAWEAKIQSAQARRPGFRGSYLEPPTPERGGVWALVLRFDTPTALDSWFACDERKALLEEAQEFVKTSHVRKIPTSFPGWFPHDEFGESPAIWKTAALVLLGLFPIVALEMLFLKPYLAGFRGPVRLFISLVGSVSGTTYITMPIFIKLFKWWLLPDKNRVSQINAIGVAVVIATVALEIAAFWSAMP